MESLRMRIDKVFRGAGKSFSRFPAAIISAIIISIVAIVRIKMGWDNERPYALLFDSIQISFLLGGVFSMASVALDEIHSGKEKSLFMLANIAGIFLAGISFLLLYFFGRKVGQDQIAYLSSIALARVSVGIFISAVAFVYTLSKSKAVASFSDSLFITHRAFIVSAIYGLVMMLGVSGVLGAFQALVYNNMSYKIYQYLGVAVGLLTYLIFLGYFPKFGQEEDEQAIKQIKQRPKFIVVLLDYIVIPIMMALTVVLLIWSVRVIFKGVETTFNGLSGIASSYVIIGIWLHIMVAKHESKLAGFYKKAYPVAGLLILVFEAWALFVQISQFGLQTAEYSFLMIWIFALISVLLLVFLKDEAYRKTAVAAVILSVIWVLPFIGYQDITFNSQIKRLEKLLVENEFLVGGEIVAKDETVDHEVKQGITSAVEFVGYSDKTGRPSWFKEDLNNYEVFRDTFGFQQTYESYPGQSQYITTDFRLDTDVIDISGYDLSLNIEFFGQEEYVKRFEGKSGSYEVKISNYYTGVPKIMVEHEGSLIIERNLGDHFAQLKSKYPEESREINLPYEDMNMLIEGEDLDLLVVFKMINIHEDQETDKKEYYVEFQGIYVKNK